MTGTKPWPLNRPPPPPPPPAHPQTMIDEKMHYREGGDDYAALDAIYLAFALPSGVEESPELGIVVVMQQSIWRKSVIPVFGCAV